MTTLDDLRLPMPAGLGSEAQRLWHHGDDTGGIKGRGATLGDPPVPGDLWIASAGADDSGPIDTALVLVLGVHEEGRFVSAVPVTAAAETPGYQHAYLMAENRLGIPLVVHAALQTGVGFPALARRLGDGLDALSVTRVVRAPFGEARSPLPVHDTGNAEDTIDDYMAGLCDLMGALCYAYSETEEAS